MTGWCSEGSAKIRETRRGPIGTKKQFYLKMSHCRLPIKNLCRDAARHGRCHVLWEDLEAPVPLRVDFSQQLGHGVVSRHLLWSEGRRSCQQLRDLTKECGENEHQAETQVIILLLILWWNYPFSGPQFIFFIVRIWAGGSPRPITPATGNGRLLPSTKALCCGISRPHANTIFRN